MSRLFAAVAAVSVACASNALAADRTAPKVDLEGSADSPLIGRYQGSIIVSYQQKEYDEFAVPLSALERVPDKRDNHNNHYFVPKQKVTVAGAHWRIVYLMPDDVSPLEVVRNYQQELQSKGGKTLYECKAQECGGDPTRSSHGGGGEMSLSMYLEPQDDVTDKYGTIGHCAQLGKISGQRYLAGALGSTGAHVSVLAFSIAPAPFSCKGLEGRTVAAVDVVEPRQREQKMVTVQAEEMAQKISSSGSVALYGIYFDFNKAEVKPESGPTLEQIARLLKESRQLKLLVVGHTDGVGSFSSNMTLSQQRANAVVKALVAQHGADKKRLVPVGVSSAAPVASNRTEEGRAKNRRVELVEN